MVVTAAVWTLFVAAALWPPFRRGTLGFASFLLSMTANEIPLVLLAVFATAMVLTEPATDAPSAVIATVLATLVGCGLIGLQVRARTARPALEAALRDTLPQDGRGLPPADARRGPLPGHWLAGIVLPFQRRDHRVVRIRNVPYGPEPRAHRLDLYHNRAPDERGPVLIHLHGGGFVQGAKSREGIVMLNQLAAHGWLCLSANYRLRRDGAHPNPLVDTKRVIAWARDHAAEYGADPARVFLAGASAGGHLAVSAALTSDQPRFQPGFENADTRVAAVVVLYGYLGARSSDPTSSPAELARRDAPPMLIIHGSHDTLIPPDRARAVAATLRDAAASPVIHAELPHAQHDFDFFASVRARVVADAVETFLTRADAHHDGRDPGRS